MLDLAVLLRGREFIVVAGVNVLDGKLFLFILINILRLIHESLKLVFLILEAEIKRFFLVSF